MRGQHHGGQQQGEQGVAPRPVQAGEAVGDQAAGQQLAEDAQHHQDDGVEQVPPDGQVVERGFVVAQRLVVKRPGEAVAFERQRHPQAVRRGLRAAHEHQGGVVAEHGALLAALFDLPRRFLPEVGVEQQRLLRPVDAPAGVDLHVDSVKRPVGAQGDIQSVERVGRDGQRAGQREGGAARATEVVVDLRGGQSAVCLRAQLRGCSRHVPQQAAGGRQRVQVEAGVLHGGVADLHGEEVPLPDCGDEARGENFLEHVAVADSVAQLVGGSAGQQPRPDAARHRVAELPVRERLRGDGQQRADGGPEVVPDLRPGPPPVVLVGPGRRLGRGELIGRDVGRLQRHRRPLGDPLRRVGEDLALLLHAGGEQPEEREAEQHAAGQENCVDHCGGQVAFALHREPGGGRVRCRVSRFTCQVSAALCEVLSVVSRHCAVLRVRGRAGAALGRGEHARR